jgi:BolA protein
MAISDEMESRLRETFSPTVLNVVDDSESHRGHAGFQEGGESHFNVEIKSTAFDGMSRIARHRAVHSALGKAIIGRIHALALDIST